MHNKTLQKILLLLGALMLAIPTILHAQRFSLEDVPLSWKNFIRKKGFGKHPYDAKIYTYFPYRYEVKNNSTELLITIEIKVDNEKSWVKDEFFKKASNEESQALLNHEKGHLMIAMIHARKLQRLFAQHQFTKKQLKIQFDSLSSMINTECDSLDLLYDEETNHMRIKDKQIEWTNKLLLQLNELYTNDKKLPMEFEVKAKI
jgi:hypothetical protein